MSKTLKTIESPAFLRCKKLKKVNIPRTLETIDFGGTIRGVFEECESLSDVTIEDGITRIPESLFQKCTGLREIKIPNTVTTICEYAFLQCVNLKNVYYCSSETDWKKIFISNGNDCLENAIINFNSSYEPSVSSETQPITEAPTDITANQTEPITDKTIESAVTEPTETVTIVPSTEPVEPPQPNTTEPTEASKSSTTDSTEPTTNSPKLNVKKSNTVKISIKTKTVKLKKLKKKAQKVKAITVKNAKGKVTYKLVKSGITKKIRKLVKINSKGVITIKCWKKAKKGTYKIKVHITVQGNSKYKPKTVNKVVKVKIK